MSRRRAVRTSVTLLLTLTLTLGPAGAVHALPAPHTTRHTSATMVWYNGSLTCTGYGSHGMLFGYAQGYTQSPDLPGNPGCYSTYTGLYSGYPDRYDESTTSDPSSVVFASGTEPEDSRHKACWALFNCAGGWNLVDN